MPRFAILEHHWEGLHWDFMLESDNALRTWSLSQPPQYGAQQEVKELQPHRLMYLDYEGEVSEGRGHVRRFDAGTFEWLHVTEESADVRIEGVIFQGHVHLHRVAPEKWTFRLEKEQA